MLIVNLVPSGQGWFPINYMVTLACELLEAKLIDLSDTGTTLFTKLAAIVSQRKASDAQEETCLLVCASPTDLLGIYKIEGWRTRFKFLAAWVIDSFWLEWIPMSVRLANPFDCIFITTGEHAEAWHRITGIDPIWLPWGTDVLRLGSGAEVREWDLLRVGRQPMQWDDDAATAASPSARAFVFIPVQAQPRKTRSRHIGLSWDCMPIRNFFSLSRTRPIERTTRIQRGLTSPGDGSTLWPAARLLRALRPKANALMSFYGRARRLNLKLLSARRVCIELGWPSMLGCRTPPCETTLWRSNDLIGGIASR
jgi:hypothetical protein